MAIFQLGFMIKKRREELKLTQEDLADGICSVPTLSRIENGDRLPTKNHFEMLLQRLGYSTTMFNFSVDEKDFYLHELKYEIRQAYISNQIELAQEYLDEFERLVSDPTQIDEQFIILYQVLLHQSQYADEVILDRLENAIQLTCPQYRNSKFPHVLSYEEIILLNIIATRYELLGKRCHAIELLTNLSNYYNNHIVNTEEALRTQLMVLYNLSKMLGLDGRYDECIEVCNLAIRIAKSTGRCSQLDKTLYNRAWACIMRNQDGDRMVAKNSIKQAYQLAQILDHAQEAKFYQRYWEKNFPKDTLL